MTYDVTHFINKFEKIQDNKWNTGNYTSDAGDRCCALGHCGVNFGRATGEGKALGELFKKYIADENSIVANINDGNDVRYPQISPKKRILAALSDIKKLQEKDTDIDKTEIPEPKPKEKIRYVSVPETINQQVKELIQN